MVELIECFPPFSIKSQGDHRTSASVHSPHLAGNRLMSMLPHRKVLREILEKTDRELEILLSSSPSASGESRERIVDPAIPLPPALPLVGRDEDLAYTRQHLCAGGNVALTVLNGLPGIGKTALAMALAHDPAIRECFSDGVLWAGLGPHPNLPEHVSRWGTQLGLSSAQMADVSSDEEWAKALRTAIGSRSLLLVIDDAWKVEEALLLMVGGPHCAHLVTTRLPSIASHLTTLGTITLHELDDKQSLDLLSQLCPQVAEMDVRKVQDLVRAVGGLPLALTLLGNSLRKQAYSGQSRRINAALEHVSDATQRLRLGEPIVASESHPSLPGGTPLSLQSVIAVSALQLNEQAREALYRLSVFPPKPKSFCEEAALAVAGCSLETLWQLTDCGLLESRSSDGYTLHPIIADYARLHLTEEQARLASARLSEIDGACSSGEAHRDLCSVV